MYDPYVKFVSYFLYRNAYVVGTHLNCLDKLKQIKMSTHNICFYKVVIKSIVVVI